MTSEEIKNGLKQFPKWYHKINLGHGIVTPGEPYDAFWDKIRLVRSKVDYKDKNVIEVGCFEGMWAFEAEDLGAKNVVATDTFLEVERYFQFCKQARSSKVISYFNISPFDLTDRLNVYFGEDFYPESIKPKKGKFDIVQFLGVLYHLRDPMRALFQLRSIIKEDGYLILETKCIYDFDKSYLLCHGTEAGKLRVYPWDITTWWIPTVLCIKEMLKNSLFEVVEDSLTYWYEPAAGDFTRICLLARPMPLDKVHAGYSEELFRNYRNPGLVL